MANLIGRRIMSMNSAILATVQRRSGCDPRLQIVIIAVRCYFIRLLAYFNDEYVLLHVTY